jgi:mycothiol system anti-sigma-R factor
MTIWAILVSLVVGLAVNECCDLAPWCARKLMHWTAIHRYTNPARAEARAEELVALINDRPGNMLKLITALTFAAGAAASSARRSLAQRMRHAQPSKGTDTQSNPQRGRNHDVALLDRVYSYLDGALNPADTAQIRQQLNEDGARLREYGLEEAVKRVLDKHSGRGEVPGDLRVKVLARISEVRHELTAP